MTDPDNFINHSCDPNLRYDTAGNVVAARDIREGEEVFIDYGFFVVNFDEPFTCSCGAHNCRGRIRRQDWKKLAVTYGMNMPRFLHSRIATMTNERPDRALPSFSGDDGGTAKLFAGFDRVAAWVHFLTPHLSLHCHRPAQSGRCSRCAKPSLGRGLFACQPIARGTPLFGEDDWADEAEARIFTVLSPAQIDKLSPALRSAFLRYGYNVALEQSAARSTPRACAIR